MLRALCWLLAPNSGWQVVLRRLSRWHRLSSPAHLELPKLKNCETVKQLSFEWLKCCALHSEFGQFESSQSKVKTRKKIQKTSRDTMRSWKIAGQLWHQLALRKLWATWWQAVHSIGISRFEKTWELKSWRTSHRQALQRDMPWANTLEGPLSWRSTS